MKYFILGIICGLIFCAYKHEITFSIKKYLPNEEKTIKTMRDLEKMFEIAKRDNLDIELELTVPTKTETEVIIVKNANLDCKLDYYKNAYDDNLILKRCTDIMILKAKVIKFEW